jgi:hypothetical protein
VNKAEASVALAPHKTTAGAFHRPDAEQTTGLPEALARRIEHCD